jgi:hypothetical protein
MYYSPKYATICYHWQVCYIMQRSIREVIKHSFIRSFIHYTMLQHSVQEVINCCYCLFLLLLLLDELLKIWANVCCIYIGCFCFHLVHLFVSLDFVVVYIYIYIRYWWTSGFGLPVRGTVVTHKDYWSRASIVFYLGHTFNVDS